VAKLAGAQAWIHVQDLEVDAASGVNLVRSNIAMKAAFSIERALLKRFHLVSAVSQKMVGAIGRKGVRADRLMLFPNWVDTSRIFPMSPSPQMRHEFGIPEGACVALYSGSLGRKQGLEHVIAAARLLAAAAEPSPIFAIAGAGPARADLEQQARGLPNVVFLPLQPEERLNTFLNLADIHLLPQRRSATDLVMPSKLAAMLATGRPVIATVPEDSQVAGILRGAGIVVPPENAAALATAISELSRNANYRRTLGEQGLLMVNDSMESELVLRNAEQRLLALSRSHTSVYKAQSNAASLRNCYETDPRDRTD
jgi:colanic acid biosynthesis glycosyl transferase WcaI